MAVEDSNVAFAFTVSGKIQNAVIPSEARNPSFLGFKPKRDSLLRSE
jgi:hypothetical protein